MQQYTEKLEGAVRKPLLRDPVSALTHLAGVLLSIIGTVLLLAKANISLDRWGLGIFGGTLICLYLASSLYHALDVSPEINLLLRKIDHLMIYVLIAGTYTPICLIALTGAWGNALLIGIWAIAIAGIALTLIWFEAPRWLTTSIYIMMGWLVAIASVPLQHTIGVTGLFWLVMGGVFYTIGGIIYGTKRPNITFSKFGFHEIFHLFVLAGSFCHYLLMLNHLPLH